MTHCNYGTPEKLARYFENKMGNEERRRFERHLVECKNCLESLLLLEKDLFLMHGTPFKRLPQHLKMKNAIFNLSRNGLKLVRNILDLNNFTPISYAPARGQDLREAKGYILIKNKFSLEIIAKEKRDFMLEISGKLLEEVRVYRGNRLIDAIALSKPQVVTIENLAPGDYSIWINGREFVSFEVR